jgi:DNA-binding NarL/FixJ family response regulator
LLDEVLTRIEPEAPEASRGPSPLRLGLSLADPALTVRVARRLASLAEVAVVADRAELVVADAPGPGPRLVLAGAPPAMAAALRAGARGVLPPEASSADFAAALAAIGRGLVVAPAAAVNPPRAASGGVNLTPREREVLELLALGASNKVIARRLGLSFHTAKAHVATVLEKLGAGSRADAVARGARAGLVQL